MDRVSDRKRVRNNGRIKPAEKLENYYFRNFKDFILKNDHPCLMAQAVFKASNVTFKIYEQFDEMESTFLLKKDLDEFADIYGNNTETFQSFIATFPDFRIYDELDFEKLLWKRLQLLHDTDIIKWDKNVSSDPNDCNFSFSISDHAFYVIGMHPESSRISRRAPVPTLVFNFHNQFEKLRSDGVYQEVRNKIRQRDYMVQGSINPMTADFGEISEARQYSGRAVEADWRCPFQPNNGD